MRWFLLRKNNYVSIVLTVLLILSGCDSILPGNSTGLPSNKIYPTRNSPNPTPTQELLKTRPNGLCLEVPKPILNNISENEEILISGKFYLCTFGMQSAIDLDKGIQGNRDMIGIEIWMGLGNVTLDNKIEYYIRAPKTTLIQEYEGNIPTKNNCENLFSIQGSFNSTLISINGTSCVKTSDGHLGFYKIDNINPYGLESVEISFVIWK